MSIADQITRLQNAKANIKTSIENKGVAVSDDATLDSYPSLIDSISVGDGEAHINPDFYDIRTQGGTNYDHLFRNYNGPEINVSNWDTSNLTSAQYCFTDCKKSFDISKWNLSSLTNATYMFDGFTNGNKYIDLSVLDFSKVSNATYMFRYIDTDCIDVRNIKLTSATDYSNLFQNCSGTELDLSGWDVSNVTSLSYMFNNTSHTKIDLTGWKTTNVTNFERTFYGASSTKLTHLIIPDWDMTNATKTTNFIYTNYSKLKYVDLSRSNDATISKIVSFLPKYTATTYGEIVIPADTSQDVINALLAKYWKPVGPKLDLVSTEIVFELDEIKPGKTTKVLTVNNNPWYGADGLEYIEFISSDESIATVNDREIRGIAEGTVTITCRRREDGVVVGSKTLTVSETDSNPNLIKFRTDGSESDYSYALYVNSTILVKKSNLTYDSITNIYSYDPGVQITKIQFGYGSSACINELIKFNFNAANITDMKAMFYKYQGTTLDLSDWDTSNVTDFYQTFNYSQYLTEIIGELDFSSANPVNSGGFNTFNNCPNLETLYIKNIYKNCTMTNDWDWDIYLGQTKVKDECLLYIIDQLPDLYNDKGLAATNRITFTLPPTNTLTESDIQPAILKGWTVANCNF